MRPLFFPAFLLLVMVLPVLMWTHEVFITRPYRGLWLLGIPLLGKSRLAALIGLVMMVAGGVLGYAKARWMPSWHQKALAFITGSVAMGFLLGLIDAVLKVFSYTLNRGVRFYSHNPLGLALGLAIALGVGLVVGLVVSALMSLLRWASRIPRRSFLRPSWIAMGGLCLATGVYFLFVFNREYWEALSSDSGWWRPYLFYGIAGFITLLGGIIIGRVFLKPRWTKMATRLVLPIGIACLLLIQVEVFGLWLQNDDSIYVAMNRPFADVTRISGSSVSASNTYLLASPDGSRILKSTRQEVDVSLAILDSRGEAIERIPSKPGISFDFSLRNSWSPDGAMVGGVARTTPQQASDDVQYWTTENEFYLWTYDVSSKSIQWRLLDKGNQSPYIAFTTMAWSPDSRTIALPVVGDTERQAELLMTDPLYSVYEITSRRSMRGTIRLYAAENLTEQKRIPADVGGFWVAFLDTDHVCYFSISSEDRSSGGAFGVLTLSSGEQTALRIRHPVARGHRTVPPLVVRGGKWLLASLYVGSSSLPYLVEISTGSLVQISGLGPGRNLMPGACWQAAWTDAHGERALVSVLNTSEYWPHPIRRSLYFWEDRSQPGAFSEYLPRLVQKEAASMSASGVIFAWGNTWYMQELPRWGAQ